MKARGAAIAVAAAVIGMLAPPMAKAAAPRSSCDWPEYGHDGDLTFETPASCSAIDTSDVATLLPKWFFHAKDSITASPAVVGDTVYDGSWDGTFYAVNAATGALRWTFKITDAAAADFGLIVASPDVVEMPDAATGGQRLVVIFGGGSSLWALDAATGRLLAHIDLDPRDAALRAAEAANPPTVEMESSPTVADVPIPGSHRTQRLIYVGMDVHNGQKIGRDGLVALRLNSTKAGAWSFDPVWKHDTETDAVYQGMAGLTANSGTGYGCGDIWSSPAADPADNEVVFGTGNCDDPPKARAAGFHWAEAMVAVNATTGALLWRFTPAALYPTEAAQIAAASQDDDFGASPNVFTLPDGERVVGEGAKSGVYWLRDLRTGAPVWDTVAGTPGNLQRDFAVGGFLGSTAVQTGSNGRAEAIFGGFAIPIPKTLGQVETAGWSVRSLDASTGRIRWALAGPPTYGSVSVVNGVLFVPDTLSSSLIALDAANGLPLWIAPIIGPPSSTAVVSGDSVYLGTGTEETDLEYKAVGLTLQKSFTDTLGQSPLSPISGIQAFRLP